MEIVKALRPWILLLLAVLLPLRGAMAAVMLCPPAAIGTQSEVRVSGQPLDHHGSDQGVEVHDHAAHGHGVHDHGARHTAADPTP